MSSPLPVPPVSPVLKVVDNRVTCQVLSENGTCCGFKSHSILSHLVSAHKMTAADYLEKFPGAETVSVNALSALEKETLRARRVPAPLAVTLTTNIMGIKLPVDVCVPEENCLPLPPGYMFPTKGKAKAVFERIIQGLARGRNLFIWGMPGTGKDAVVHAYSAMTRKPVVMVTFRPGTDLAPWFYTRSISEDGTGWEYGHLWHALTEGVVGRDGKRRPVLVLLSDVDRADSAQAEWFRILTDSIEGRILDPHGKMVPLMPGTQFVCTANSCGSGDARGRMASSNPMDASILDRLGRKVQAAYMDWSDEVQVLRAKFPRVLEMAPGVFDQLGNATEALRKAIEAEEIYAEFTHRGLCEVLSECDDILSFGGSPTGLLKKGFRSWMDGLDADTQLTAKRLVSPHLKDGAFGSAGKDDDY